MGVSEINVVLLEIDFILLLIPFVLHAEIITDAGRESKKGQRAKQEKLRLACGELLLSYSQSIAKTMWETEDKGGQAEGAKSRRQAAKQGAWGCALRGVWVDAA